MTNTTTATMKNTQPDFVGKVQTISIPQVPAPLRPPPHSMTQEETPPKKRR